MNKVLLFSLNASDFDFQYVKGSGPGGQKINKTNSKVRCSHRESGAFGESQETRSQHINKQLAFRKCIDTKEFKVWHKIEVAKRLGKEYDIESKVNSMMQDKHLRVEIRENGKWCLAN